MRRPDVAADPLVLERPVPDARNDFLHMLRDRLRLAHSQSTFTYPEQVPAPYTILIEDIPGPGEPHKHIDMIYFCRPVVRNERAVAADQTLRWVCEDELKAAQALDVAGCGISARVPDDVRELALIAIEVGGR